MMTTMPETIQMVLLTILVSMIDLISVITLRVENIKSSRGQTFESVLSDRDRLVVP